MDKLADRWSELVLPEDVVVLGGDISWGINFKEAQADFAFLNQLPGKKIILKGNHDLWWNTAKKMNSFLHENGFQNFEFLHNNCYFYENAAICGTRGWFYEEEFRECHDEKIFRRELMRLETSLKLGQKAQEIYCFLHYPPLYANFRCTEIIELLKKYNVKCCYYGHLHSESLRYAVEGVYDGVEFRLVSGDHINFTPQLVKK